MLVHRKQERTNISALIFKDDNPIFINGIIADDAAAGYVVVCAQIILNSYSPLPVSSQAMGSCR